MPKYIVTLEEIVLYKVEVEAIDEDQAQDDAKEIWSVSSNPTEDFKGSGNGVESIDVELVS